MIIRYCVPTAPRLCICNPHAHCSCFPMQPPPSQPGNTAEHIRYLCFTLIVGTCPSLQQCGQQWEFHRTGFLTWNCLDSTKSTFWFDSWHYSTWAAVVNAVFPIRLWYSVFALSNISDMPRLQIPNCSLSCWEFFKPILTTVANVEMVCKWQPFWHWSCHQLTTSIVSAAFANKYFHSFREAIKYKLLQELRMLSSVTRNCQVMNSGSQFSEL